jgi:hypothetical protein
LDLANRERHLRSDFAQERQAGALIEMPIQPQDSNAGAIVDRGLLKPLTVLPRDDLDVDLHAVARLLLLE